MKRDWDVIRCILMKVEEEGHVEIPYLHGSVMTYTAELLIKAGFVEEDPDLNNTILIGLTWEGHDFLDSIRGDKVWKGTREKLIEIGGSATFSVVKAVAEKVALTVVGLS